MGVVNHDGQVARAAEVLQAAGGGLEARQGHEDLVRVRAQANGGRVDGEEVVGVVRADEAAPGLLSVNAEEHPLEALFQDAGGVVGRALAGVGDHLRGGILDHHGTVLVIDIDDRVRGLREVVEEELLAAEILREGLVVVQVVVGEVGEDARGELEARHALLLHTDGTHFHEAVPATCIDHLGEEAVDGDRVGRRVGGLQPAVVHVVGDRGQQAAGMAQGLEQAVQQGDGRGLPVRSRDAHERQLPARMSVERIRRHRHCVPAVRHLHERDVIPGGS